MIGHKIIVLPTVDSTNNYVAKLLYEQNIGHGTVILADSQVTGRGQRGAEWQTEPGKNLTFSFLLSEVNLSVDEQFLLTQLTSISVIDTLQNFGIEAKIKWPNDIYVNEQKIAGILIENNIKGIKIKESIVGIGLNVNQQDFTIPGATSMIIETGVLNDLKEVLMVFISEFNRNGRLLSFPSNLLNAYYEKLMRYQSEAKYSDQDGEFTGIITGVSSLGELEVKKNGENVKYRIREIKFI